MWIPTRIALNQAFFMSFLPGRTTVLALPHRGLLSLPTRANGYVSVAMAVLALRLARLPIQLPVGLAAGCCSEVSLLSSGNERELSLLMLWSLKVAGSPHAIATQAHRPISIFGPTAEAAMCWEPDASLGAPRAPRVLRAVGTVELSGATKDVAIDEAD